MSHSFLVAYSVFEHFKFAGVYSDEATPDPIPNSADKLVSGDGTARETVCESSTMPASFYGVHAMSMGPFFI